MSELGSDAQFYVMGVQIDASEAEGSEILADLLLGQFVLIDGFQDGEGTLKATSISSIDELACDALDQSACAGVLQVF